MSRIGIGANIQTPNRQCLSCKRWKPAGKLDVPYGFTQGGKCSLGYCEKQRKNKNFRGK